MWRRMILTLVVLAGALVAVLPARAQSGETDITVLNDSAPGIDVVITPVPGSSGAIRVEAYQAMIRMTDEAGRVVFETADPRVHLLELRLAPDAGTHVLTVERLPGVAEGYVRVTPRLDLADTGPVLLVDARQPLGFQQEADLPLGGTAPSAVTAVDIAAGQQGMVSLAFPGAPVTAQVVDASGQAVATLYGGQLDGLNLLLDEGHYETTLLNTAPDSPTVANVRLAAARAATDLQSFAEGHTQPVSLEGGAGGQAAQTGQICTITINVSSINLRSGPGTGYSVLDYGFRGEELVVGGTNTTGTWLLVASEEGAAWMSGTLGVLQGGCDGLPVYDIPYREARQPEVIVQPAQPVFVQAPASAAPASQGRSEEHDDDDDHDEREHDDDHEEHDD
ncbi:MAG: hypothetical protein Kow0077_25280 [Anaerolineae bacterium]